MSLRLIASRCISAHPPTRCNSAHPIAAQHIASHLESLNSNLTAITSHLTATITSHRRHMSDRESAMKSTEKQLQRTRERVQFLQAQLKSLRESRRACARSCDGLPSQQKEMHTHRSAGMWQQTASVDMEAYRKRWARIPGTSTFPYPWLRGSPVYDPVKYGWDSEVEDNPHSLVPPRPPKRLYSNFEMGIGNE